MNPRKEEPILERSKIDITVDILRVAMDGANKNRIVHEVKINFGVAKKYLQMLNEKELIRYEKGLFITTDKGRVFQEMAKGIKL